MRLVIDARRISIGGINLLARLAGALAEAPELEHIDLVLSVSVKGATRIYDLASPRLHIDDLSELRRTIHSVKRIAGIPGTGRVQYWLKTFSWDMNPNSIQERHLNTRIPQADLFYQFWPHLAPYRPSPIPMVCTVQDTTHLEFPELMGMKATDQERVQLGKWVGAARRVVVPSAAIQRSVLRHFPDTAGKLHVINHAILPWPLTEVESGPQQLDSLRAKFGIPEGYFLAPIGVPPHKNPSALLYAWSRFPHRDRYGLVLTGPDTESIDPARGCLKNREGLLEGKIGGTKQQLNPTGVVTSVSQNARLSK